MKISKSELKKIITEEFNNVIILNEENNLLKAEQAIDIAESDIVKVQNKLNEVSPRMYEILESVLKILNSKEYNFLYDVSKTDEENKAEKQEILLDRKEEIDNINNRLSQIMPGVQIDDKKLMDPLTIADQLNNFISYLAGYDIKLRRFKKSGLIDATQAERAAKLIKINKKLKSLEGLFFRFEAAETYQEKSQAIFDYYKNLKPNETEIDYLKNLFSEQNKIKVIYTQVLTKLKLDINKSIFNLLKGDINLNNLIYVATGAVKKDLKRSAESPSLFQKFKKLLSPGQKQRDAENEEARKDLVARANEIAKVWGEINNFKPIINLMARVNSSSPSVTADFKKFQLVPNAPRYRIKIPRKK